MIMANNQVIFEDETATRKRNPPCRKREASTDY